MARRCEIEDLEPVVAQHRSTVDIGVHPVVVWATVLGFVGGKLYYLAEHAGSLSAHSFGPSGSSSQRRARGRNANAGSAKAPVRAK